MKKKVLVFILVFAIAVLAYASVQKKRSFVFEYEASIKNIPSGASLVKVWIPHVPDLLYQKAQNITNYGELKPTIMYDEKYKNKVLFYMIESPKNSEIRLNAKYKVIRYEHLRRPGTRSLKKSEHVPSELEKYLAPSRLVTLSPRIRKLAESITEGKESDLEKARAIYDYVFKNVAYDKTIPGWGQGDTERVCDVRTGNCTDFHSFFISLARASGIPARFIIGVPVHEERKNQSSSYHCWAEFYVGGAGWIPVDISEAWKDKAKYEYYFGTLDENRIELSRGRDIILEMANSSQPLNYFINPHVEIDGEVFEDVAVVFRFKDYNRGKTKGGK